MLHKNKEKEKYTRVPGFSLHYYLLTALGQWPYQNKWQKSIIRTIGNSIMIVANLSSFTALYDTKDDFDAVIERIPMCMTGVIYFINFLTLVTQSSKMKLLLDSVQKYYQTIEKNSEEEKILKQVSMKGTFIMSAYCLIVWSGICLYCFSALIPIFLNIVLPLNESRTKNYIYDCNYIIFEKEDHYYFTFCHSTIAGIYCFATSTSFDIMLYGFVNHISGLFLVLKYRLKNILHSNEIIQSLSEKDYMKIKNETVACIKLYNDTVLFANNVESCFTTCLTFTMGILAIILCFLAVMIVVRIDEPDFVMMFGTNFMGEAVHLFFNCFTGQILLNSSEALAFYIYDSNWYLMPSKPKTMVLMMMTRSLKNCKVTIGKFFILNNETYGSLMKTVFSYLSVLMSVRG